MKFTETKLKGAYTIEPEFIEDERGFFARSWCVQEFEAHGFQSLEDNIVYQLNKYDLVRLGTLLSTPANEYPLLVADTKKLNYSLDWKPRYNLDDGLEQTINYWGQELK